MYVAVSINKHILLHKKDILVPYDIFISRFKTEFVYFAKLPSVDNLKIYFDESKKRTLHQYSSLLVVYDTCFKLKGYPIFDVCLESQLEGKLLQCRYEFEKAKHENLNEGFGLADSFEENYIFVDTLPKYHIKYGKKIKLVPMDEVDFKSTLEKLSTNYKLEEPEELDYDFSIGPYHGGD